MFKRLSTIENVSYREAKASLCCIEAHNITPYFICTPFPWLYLDVLASKNDLKVVLGSPD